MTFGRSRQAGPVCDEEERLAERAGVLVALDGSTCAFRRETIDPDPRSFYSRNALQIPSTSAILFVYQIHRP